MPPVYSPGSPQSSPLDDDKPLDFSKSSTPKEIKYEIDGPLSGKYLKSDLCFTTPSPSPPERNSFSQTNSEQTEMLVKANQLFGKFLDEGLLAQLQSQVASVGGGANSQLLKQALQLATLNTETHNPLMSMLMQSAASPAVANLELLQNITKSISTTATVANKHAELSTMSAKLGSPINDITANSQQQHASHHHGSQFLVNQSATPLTQHSPNAYSVPLFGTNGGLLTTASNVDSRTHEPQHPKTIGNNVRVSPPPPPPSSSAPVPTVGSTTTTVTPKYTRPFKALYGKDTLMPTATTPPIPTPTETLAATQSILLSNSDQAYQEFRKQMLITKRSSTGSRSSRTPVKSSSSASSVHSNGDLQSDDNSNASNSSSGEGDGGNARMSADMLFGTNQQPQRGTPTSTVTLTSTSPVSSTNWVPPPVYSNSQTQHPSTPPNNSQQGRKRGRPLPDDLKDEAYWERRRKNNEAAKRSRDLRRAKEDEIAIRAAFLEQENFRLKCELIQAKIEYDKMRTLWLSTQQGQQQQNQTESKHPSISV